jgi:hypothetical protein
MVVERNDLLAVRGPFAHVIVPRWVAVPCSRPEPELVPQMAPPALRIGPDARWFQVAGAEPQDLRRRRPLRAIVRALAIRHAEGRGTALSLEDLLAIGWPGERVIPCAGANRVYVALTTLRNMGLRGRLILQRRGYLLDPALGVELVPDVEESALR